MNEAVGIKIMDRKTGGKMKDNGGRIFTGLRHLKPCVQFAYAGGGGMHFLPDSFLIACY